MGFNSKYSIRITLSKNQEIPAANEEEYISITEDRNIFNGIFTADYVRNLVTKLIDYDNQDKNLLIKPNDNQSPNGKYTNGKYTNGFANYDYDNAGTYYNNAFLPYWPIFDHAGIILKNIPYFNKFPFNYKNGKYIYNIYSGTSEQSPPLDPEHSYYVNNGFIDIRPIDNYGALLTMNITTRIERL